jgi:hypothetical protein
MSLWYIGDPCYAIDDYTWGEFCDEVFNFKNDAREGDGIEFNWETHRVCVYNSGLGGDGQVNVHGYQLSVDAGLLSVLPIEVCRLLSDAEKTEGQQVGHAIVEARFRPVFDIDTNNFPHITLDINGSIKHDTTGMSQCDRCGEWCAEYDMTTDDCYLLGNDCCYEEKEEGEDL